MRLCEGRRWRAIAAVVGLVILVGVSGCPDVPLLDRPRTVDWARTLTAGSTSALFFAVAVDGAGNVYAAGDQYGDGTYGYGDGVEAAGSASPRNPVLVKYNANGEAQWVRTLTSGAGRTEFADVAVDGTGNVYAAGSQFGVGTYNYGDGVEAAGSAFFPGGYNPVLVKYYANGVAQWARTLTAGSDSALFWGIAVDGSGNVYAAGNQFGDGTYGYGNEVEAVGSSEWSNPVLVKYNANGLAQWARTLTAGTDDAVFFGVAVDGNANVYAAGSQSGAGTYDYGDEVQAAGASESTNAVLVKYNTNGEAQWARTLTDGPGRAEFMDVAVDASGNVYAAGYQYGDGTYDYGDGVKAAGSSEWDNPVLVKYNASGVAQWARTLTEGYLGATFDGVAIDGSGNVYAAGAQLLDDIYGYGDGVQATGSAEWDNPVLVKYNANGVAQWARTLNAGSGMARFWGVAADGSANVYAAGYQWDVGTYDYGDGVTATGTAVRENSVLVKYAP